MRRTDHAAAVAYVVHLPKDVASHGFPADRGGTMGPQGKRSLVRPFTDRMDVAGMIMLNTAADDRPKWVDAARTFTRAPPPTQV